MYINRTLILGLVLVLVSLPLIADWLTSDYTAWYRPYIAWSVIVALTWWGQRSRLPDEL